MRDRVLLIVVSLILVACLIPVLSMSNDCTAKGGVLVKGVGTYQCVEVKK
jgi:hypothetical protein